MKPTRVIILMWLAWVLIILGFQAWVTARLDLRYPDRAQDWTSRFTGDGYQQGHVYLLEPFLNRQVAWDSEYYLSIAVGGYDDPRAPHLTPEGIVTSAGISASPPSGISVNYAFFPLYPFLIRLVAFPLQILGLTPIATAALAGVIISALGTLLGMLSLYDLTRGLLGQAGALRAVFYLIIFPTAFFLLQVYTEGLFVGLAFACLAMAKRKNFLAAALFGAAATLTRAVGVTLVLPLGMIWLRTGEWRDLVLGWRQVFYGGLQLRSLLHAFLVLTPLVTFLIWKFSYLGQGFDWIETNYYHRGFLSIGQSVTGWAEAIRIVLGGREPQSSAYYLTEFLGLAIALAACIVCIRIDPDLGWFSAAVVLISWGSGHVQGIHRYILGAPAVFVGLSLWGRNPVFDRAWTILSILLLGALAMLFAFNMWVA